MEDEIERRIDWEDIWRRQFERATFQLKTKEFEDRAEAWNSAMRGNTDTGYVDELLASMELSSDTSMLDVGCGSGIISIPLAKKVRHVTALDLSPAMLDLTMRYAMEEGVTNISTVTKDWLHVQIGVDVGVHDVVLASRCLQVENLRRFLLQMDNAARRSCYLTWGTGAREDDAELCVALGLEYRPQPSYQIVYNLLYDMGIFANVKIHSGPVTRWFRDLDDAVKQLVRGRPISPEATEKLKAYFKEKLPYREGRYWRVIRAPWALISWPKKD